MAEAFHFEWNGSSSDIIYRKGFNYKLNHRLAEICLQYMEPFTPYKTGALSRNIQIRKHDKDEAQIVYLTRYARYQYYGDNSWNRTKYTHPLATSYWDKAALTGHKRQILKEVNEYRKAISQ